MCARSHTSGLMIGSIWRSSCVVVEVRDDREGAFAGGGEGVDEGVGHRVGRTSVTLIAADRYGDVGLPPLSRRQWPGWREHAHTSDHCWSCTRTLSPRVPAAGAPSTARRRSGAGSRSSPSPSSSAAPLGVKKPANQNDYIGRVGQGRPLVDDHFPKQDDENVLVQARQGRHGDRPGRAQGGRRRHRRRLGPAGRRRGQVALRQGQRGPDLQGRPLRARRASRSAATTTRRASAIDPVVAAVDRRSRPRNPKRLRRPVRRRQRQQGALEVVLGRLQEGRDALAADHADHPRPRLRRARRRRRPAAARADRGHGHARPRRDPEPVRARWTTPSARSCCSSAWRWASTTRSSTCAANARRRRAGASKLRGRPHGRRDLGPRRARLRLHRDGRHGRHVPRRRADLHRARRRRDHGRRRRDDRLGHRRAGRARRGSATASRRAACPFLHGRRSSRRREPRLGLRS